MQLNQTPHHFALRSTPGTVLKPPVALDASPPPHAPQGFAAATGSDKSSSRRVGFKSFPASADRHAPQKNLPHGATRGAAE